MTPLMLNVRSRPITDIDRLSSQFKGSGDLFEPYAPHTHSRMKVESAKTMVTLLMRETLIDPRSANSNPTRNVASAPIRKIGPEK